MKLFCSVLSFHIRHSWHMYRTYKMNEFYCCVTNSYSFNFRLLEEAVFQNSEGSSQDELNSGLPPKKEG